ncbi:hypothetical protein MRB53_021455 [Persea americana]|uniref:Uncharacterized protein n=1 Tax=Persea americana TaxID=3435 RepID=A0ACC2L4E8_PERAE|nr:hypothetical protein MRB53_021455 [Persea americana]
MIFECTELKSPKNYELLGISYIVYLGAPALPTKRLPKISHTEMEALSQQTQLDQAAAYIKKLRENIEGLKERRALAAHIVGINKDMSDGMMIELRTPVTEVKDLGSTVDVVLISVLNRNFMLCDVISVLEEEGAEVVNASFSQVAN